MQIRRSAPPEITIDPTAMYQCLVGYVGKAGSYREGDQLRGSHEAVRVNPTLWAPTGLDHDELGRLRLERFPVPDVSPGPDPRIRIGGEIPVERRLRVTRTLLIGDMFVLAAGQIVDREDKAIVPLIKKYPDHFASATPRRRASDRAPAA
jgi:hypothetical protein